METALETFTTMNREWQAEFVVWSNGQIGYRQFVDPAEDPPFSRCTWEAFLAGWPSARGIHTVGMDSAAIRKFVLKALIERDGQGRPCTACGRGPVVQREVGVTVHPVSGDAYGEIEHTCLACETVTRTPFAEN